MIKLKLAQDFNYEIPKDKVITIEGKPYKVVRRYKETLWLECGPEYKALRRSK